MSNIEIPKRSHAFSWREILHIFKPRQDPSTLVKFIIIAIGLLFSFLPVFGAFWGYKRAYNRYLVYKEISPRLAPAPPIAYVCMLIGAVLFFALGELLLFGLRHYFQWLAARARMDDFGSGALVGYAVLNIIFIIVAFIYFERWRRRQFNELVESERFGTARFANADELRDLYSPGPGLYIGGAVYKYQKQGHLLTVAGTRGGKGVNLIIPNLLGKGGYQGSFVVIDPKGENAAVTARYQRAVGQEVLILDPWNLVTKPGENSTYNPLDLLQSENEEALVDDASVIAEMIVPPNEGGEQFFNDRARSFITGMLIHLVLTDQEEKEAAEEAKKKKEKEIMEEEYSDGELLSDEQVRDGRAEQEEKKEELEGQMTLDKIWRWLRLNKDEWAELLSDMCVSKNDVVQATGKEILTLMQTALETYGSVMSAALQYTDFLKSPALQQSLKKSNFNVNDLSGGKTTMYVVIPADKLKSHYQWLRLVVTTALRSVVRNKNKRVTFILDEFAALGTLSEIEVALSTYAGYNVTIWAILQSLIQLQDKYGKSWETFLGNTAVRHFFNIGDNFTANYVSQAMGQTSFVTYEQSSTTGMSEPKATQRALITPDEVRRGSADNIFALIEQRHPTYFPKKPYYEMPELEGEFDENPYYS